MFSKRFYLVVLLLGIAGLLLGVFSKRTIKGPVASPDAGNASIQKGGEIESDQARSVNERHGETISEDERIELAHNAIANVQFPMGVIEAEAKLTEELNFLYSLPPSHERNFLQSFLMQACAKATFEACSSKEELLSRMERFGAIVKKSAADVDVERLLIFASEQCAKMIRELPSKEGDVLRSYLESQGAAGDVQIGARIAASCYVDELVGSEEIDSALINEIDDENVKMLAERTFLRTFDFGGTTEKVVETFATRYLDVSSKIDSDHQIAIGLFGVGLQRYPEAISAVILSAPPSQKKDEAIEQMIFRIAAGDHDRARLWWDQIQDPEIKKRAEIDILGKRLGSNSKPLPVADPGRDPFSQ